MIGDGMGLTQITGARTVNGGNLHMLNCKSIGIQSTHCADKYVTDSGASATAMSSGKKQIIIMWVSTRMEIPWKQLLKHL